MNPVIEEEAADMLMEDQMLDETDTEAETPTPASAASKGKGKRKSGENGSKKGGTKKLRSFVWNHFSKTKADLSKSSCHYCGKLIGCLSSSGTSGMKKHLKSCKEYKAWQATADGEQHVVNQGSDGSVQVAKVSEPVFREAVNEMIVLGELPLAFIDSLAWRHFCNKVKLYKPLSRRTVTRDIVEMYSKRKNLMKKVFAGKQQRVSLTTDIWVAPNTGASYMVITAHFIDSNWQLKKFIIGFKNVTDHKGSTIARVLEECLEEWDIKRVFCITVDNATANSLAISYFKSVFSLVGEGSLVLGGEFLHLRCATHILNLIVKDGLHEVDHSVAAIRNGIQYVRSSTPRLLSFQLRVDTQKMTRGSLPLDCKTRWNSTYLMLNRAMHFRLTFDKMEAEDKTYNDYFEEGVDGKKRAGPPVKNDWDVIQRLLNFLGIYYEATLELSASTKVSSYKIYNEIVSIQEHLNQLSNDPEEELRKKAKAMITKLGKYWDPFGEETEMNRLLIVATVFDPRSKLKFVQLCFDELYGKDSQKATMLYESTMDILKRLYEEYSQNRKTSASAAANSQSQSQSQSSGSSSATPRSNVHHSGREQLSTRVGFRKLSAKYKEMVQESSFEKSATELDLYLAENVENPHIFAGTDYCVLSWWKVNSLKFPVLSEIAKDILAMQVSSVASESAFSTSGRILDPSRSCLTHYTLEVLMCLQQWLKTEIHMSNKGSITIEDLLDDIEDQDELQREFGDLGVQD